MARSFRSPATPSPWCQALLDQLPDGEDDFRYTTWRVVFVDGSGRTRRSQVNGTWLGGAWEGGVIAPVTMLEGPDRMPDTCEGCDDPDVPAFWEYLHDAVLCGTCRHSFTRATMEA